MPLLCFARTCMEGSHLPKYYSVSLQLSSQISQWICSFCHFAQQGWVAIQIRKVADVMQSCVW
eukprot:2659239-Amphidinium_carterae.1